MSESVTKIQLLLVARWKDQVAPQSVAEGELESAFAFSPNLISFYDLKRLNCKVLFDRRQVDSILTRSNRIYTRKESRFTPELDTDNKFVVDGETTKKIQAIVNQASLCDKKNSNRLRVVQEFFRDEQCVLRTVRFDGDEKVELFKLIRPSKEQVPFATLSRNGNHCVLETLDDDVQRASIELIDVDSNERVDFLLATFKKPEESSVLYRFEKNGGLRPISDSMIDDIVDLGEHQTLKKLRQKMQSKNTQ